ncbi:hypothetical protein C1646_748171 [Rhizophagus diaphanus]|nr:hypothetical protein C1646_748171 [Rhizophagus diaphanus] [Rhizophagus sp. MUCL 43196]
MSNYFLLFRVLSPSRVQTKFEENSLPASPTLNPKRSCRRGNVTRNEISKYLKNLPPSSIHIIVEPLLPATTEKGKRSLVDSDEGQNSKRAKFAGRRVVFLPDCRQLAVNPVDYTKSALFLAYHDDDAKINEINSCENFENIVDFCKKLQFKEKLYFIVDQMNALDELDKTGVSLEIKQQIRRDIDKMSNYHYYIMSFSANNKTMLYLMQKQTGELKIKLYGGFNEEEMEEWWKKYSLPAMNDQEKERIKDITEYSHENFEGAFAYLKQKLKSIIQKPMTEYSENLLGNKHIWDRHVRLMLSFITNTHPKLGYRDDDYDNRYFYIEDDDICYYVCGLVRDSMAEYLFEKREMKIFTDIKWISRIADFKNNPSVKGFFVEKTCIASIFRYGLMANHVNFKPGGMEFFYNEKEIKFSLNEEKCMFYLPCCWNQEAIDGLLILQTKDKLYIAPVQITLNKDNHSDSERKFFSSIWPNLKPNLSSFEDKLEIMFIWITHRSETDELVECITKETRNKNYEINPNYTQSQIVIIEETNCESDKETKEQKSAQRRRGRPKKSL